MRKFLFLIVLLFAFKAKAQIGYEDFYSVSELEINLKRAKTVLEQMDAAGCLAVRYKHIRNDSLKNLYLKKVFALAQNGNDIKLMGRALWWDLYFESSVYDDWDYKASDEKAGKLFKYAEQHDLLKEKISCNLLIADIKIHKDILAAEKYSQAAQGLLNEWKKDTTRRFTPSPFNQVKGCWHTIQVSSNSGAGSWTKGGWGRTKFCGKERLEHTDSTWEMG